MQKKLPPKIFGKQRIRWMKLSRGVVPALLWELDAKHSAVIFLGLQLALTNQLEKGSVARVATPLGLLEGSDIIVTQDRRDGDDTVALIH